VHDALLVGDVEGGRDLAGDVQRDAKVEAAPRFGRTLEPVLERLALDEFQPRRWSSARYTSPMPPAPRRPRTS
jgi:hypothetical protein